MANDEVLRAAEAAFQQFDIVSAVQHWDVYIAALQEQIDALHASMTARIETISEQSKHYLDGLNTPADSAYFADTIEKLEAAVPQIYDSYEKIAVVKTRRAQALLSQAKSLAALEDLPYQAMRYQYGFDQFDSLSLWQGENLNDCAVVILPPVDIMEELYLMNYYSALVERCEHALIVADVTLAEWLQAALPKAAVVGLRKNQTITKIDPVFTHRIHAEMLPWYAELHGLTPRSAFTRLAQPSQPHVVVALQDMNLLTPAVKEKFAALDQIVTLLTDGSPEQWQSYFPAASDLRIVKPASLSDCLNIFQTATHVIAEQSTALYLGAMLGLQAYILSRCPLWQTYGEQYFAALPTVRAIYVEQPASVAELILNSD